MVIGLQMDIKVPEHHETSTKPAPVKTPAPETVERLGDDDEQQLEMSFDHVGGSRLQNILEMDLPRPKALLGHHAYDAGQGAIAGWLNCSDLMINFYFYYRRCCGHCRRDLRRVSIGSPRCRCAKVARYTDAEATTEPERDTGKITFSTFVIKQQM